MKIASAFEIAAIAVAGVLVLSTGVKAEPSSRACWSMADTVKAALAAHPDASQAAWEQYRAGTQACGRGYTAFGISHLQAAMKALGG